MKLQKLIASGLGTGYSPIAPGTAGSILGILLLYVFNYGLTQNNIGGITFLVFNLVALVCVLLIGVYSIKEVHKVWKHDAGKIVIDEIVGVWITVLIIPFHWQYYLIGLILFRFFDILKPFYIRKLDRLKSDWSVMLDDVLAGVYANIVLQIIVYFYVL